MPAITLLPANAQGGELSASLTGAERLVFAAVLDRRMNLRLLGGADFPLEGLVTIRRGYDFNDAGDRIVDEFRYEESYRDGETGESGPVRFTAILFIEESAFDRLLGRIHWGLPRVHLFFELSSEVITFEPGGDAEDLLFQPVPRPWERVSGATLVQQPWGSAS